MNIRLILCVLFFVLGCADFSTKNSSEKLPIRTLSILIEEDQREELFVQLQKFANKHSLEFHLNFYKNKEIFSVEMYGKQLEILSLSMPISTTELDINFYEEDPNNPPSDEIVNELFNDLKFFINEIPSVVITNKE